MLDANSYEADSVSAQVYSPDSVFSRLWEKTLTWAVVLAGLDGIFLVFSVGWPVFRSSQSFSFRPMPFLFWEYSPLVYWLDKLLILLLVGASFLYGYGLWIKRQWAIPLGIITCIVNLLDEAIVAMLSRTFEVAWYWTYYPLRGPLTSMLLTYLLIPSTRRTLGVAPPALEQSIGFKSVATIALCLGMNSLFGIIRTMLLGSLNPAEFLIQGLSPFFYSLIVAIWWDPLIRLNQFLSQKFVLPEYVAQ